MEHRERPGDSIGLLWCREPEACGTGGELKRHDGLPGASRKTDGGRTDGSDSLTLEGLPHGDPRA